MLYFFSIYTTIIYSAYFFAGILQPEYLSFDYRTTFAIYRIILSVVSEINNTNWKSGKKYGNIQKRSNPAEATHEERKIASLKKGARVP